MGKIVDAKGCGGWTSVFHQTKNTNKSKYNKYIRDGGVFDTHEAREKVVVVTTTHLYIPNVANDRTLGHVCPAVQHHVLLGPPVDRENDTVNSNAYWE